MGQSLRKPGHERIECVSQRRGSKVGVFSVVEGTGNGCTAFLAREGEGNKTTHLYTIAVTPSYRNALLSADPISPDATACSDFGEVLVR